MVYNLFNLMYLQKNVKKSSTVPNFEFILWINNVDNDG